MKIILKSLHFFLLLAMNSYVSAAVFTSGNGAGPGQEWSAGMQGQAFRPDEQASPDLSPLSTVYLQEFTFTLGGFDNQPGASQTVLNIYAPDALTIADATLIGVSNNIVNTVNAPGDVEDDFGLPPVTYTFTFDDLALDYTTIYLALFTDLTTGNTISLNVEQGFEGVPSFPGPPWVQDLVYGGGVFSYDDFGWAEETNADYVATFSTTTVPIPASIWFFVSSLLVGGVLKRKRSRRSSV